MGGVFCEIPRLRRLNVGVILNLVIQIFHAPELRRAVVACPLQQRDTALGHIVKLGAQPSCRQPGIGIPAVGVDAVMLRVRLPAVFHRFTDLPGGDAVAVEFHSSRRSLSRRQKRGTRRKGEAMEDKMVAGIHPFEQQHLMLPIRQIVFNHILPAFGAIAQDQLFLLSIQNHAHGVLIEAVPVGDTHTDGSPPKPKPDAGAGIDKHRFQRFFKIDASGILQGSRIRRSKNFTGFHQSRFPLSFCFIDNTTSVLQDRLRKPQAYSF